MEENMKYRVGTFRNAGLEARWTRTRKGAPMIAARNTGGKWFVVDGHMWEKMKVIGVREQFERSTLFGDIFSIPA